MGFLGGLDHLHHLISKTGVLDSTRLWEAFSVANTRLSTRRDLVVTAKFSRGMNITKPGIVNCCFSPSDGCENCR